MRLPTAPRATALALALAALGALGAAARPAAAQAALKTPNGAPHAPAPAASWAGVYRVAVTILGEAVPMRVVIERRGDRLDGTLLVDNSASALERVRSDGEALRARVTTSAGEGELVLRATATGVAGTITVGKATWAVVGERSA